MLSSLRPKLLTTSRHLKVLQEQFLEACCFEINPQDSDVERYINKEIDSGPNLCKLFQNMDPSEREEFVASAKGNHCGGM